MDCRENARVAVAEGGHVFSRNHKNHAVRHRLTCRRSETQHAASALREDAKLCTKKLPLCVIICSSFMSEIRDRNHLIYSVNIIGSLQVFYD